MVSLMPQCHSNLVPQHPCHAGPRSSDGPSSYAHPETFSPTVVWAPRPPCVIHHSGIVVRHNIESISISMQAKVKIHDHSLNSTSAHFSYKINMLSDADFSKEKPTNGVHQSFELTSESARTLACTHTDSLTHTHTHIQIHTHKKPIPFSLSLSLSLVLDFVNRTSSFLLSLWR